MKVEEYLEKHPNDSDLMIGLLMLALVDNWNREYDPEYTNKLNEIFESYLSMRDAQIEFEELLISKRR